LTKKDQYKAYQLLSKPYLADTFLLSNTDELSGFKDQLRGYKEHIKEMVESNCKFEVEALFSSKD
jgi:hypothetical protein